MARLGASCQVHPFPGHVSPEHPAVVQTADIVQTRGDTILQLHLIATLAA